jgi:hypothetical protein
VKVLNKLSVMKQLQKEGHEHAEVIYQAAEEVKQ